MSKCQFPIPHITYQLIVLLVIFESLIKPSFSPNNKQIAFPEEKVENVVYFFNFLTSC